MNIQSAAVCHWLRQCLTASLAATSKASFTRLSLVWATAILVFVHNFAHAQNSYPTTPTSTQAWGGYSVAQAVPYQPTLTPPEAPVVITPTPPPDGQAYALANPIPLPSQPPTVVPPNVGPV